MEFGGRELERLLRKRMAPIQTHFSSIQGTHLSANFVEKKEKASEVRLQLWKEILLTQKTHLTVV